MEMPTQKLGFDCLIGVAQREKAERHSPGMGPDPSHLRVRTFLRLQPETVFFLSRRIQPNQVATWQGRNEPSDCEIVRRNGSCELEDHETAYRLLERSVPAHLAAKAE
jgi:hypothetical protein